MTLRTVFLTLGLTLMLSNCAKKTPDKVALSPTADVDAILSQAIEDIEADYQAALNFQGEDRGVSDRSAIYLPAGSEDELAAAIAAARPHQRIILRSGSHYENDAVIIDKPVQIIGEDGAVLYCDNQSGHFYLVGTPIYTDAGLHVKDANRVKIQNLEIRPYGAQGSIAIFTENAQHTMIVDNDIHDFQFGIWTSNHSDKTSIYDNTITGVGGGGGVGALWGIVIESGDNARIMNNHIADYGTGIFASSRRGIYHNNTAMDVSIGILSCTVQGALFLPNGLELEHAVSCDDWIFSRNDVRNSYLGYLAIDGAHDNLFAQNTASNSVLYDVEMAGETQRFGFTTPTSYNNLFVPRRTDYNTIVIKLCGDNNEATGGVLVDLDADPCW